MKPGLHPEVKSIVITCACGESYDVKSTQENMRVEICSKCHPFYTGKQRFVTKGGRVERFQRKYGTREESK